VSGRGIDGLHGGAGLSARAGTGEDGIEHEAGQVPIFSSYDAWERATERRQHADASGGRTPVGRGGDP